MKKISLLISVFLVTASIFYSLKIISDSNQCTSIRKYYCIKKEAGNDGVVTVIKDGSQENIGDISYDDEVSVADERVRADIIPTGDLFAKGLVTQLSKVISKGDSFRMVYEGKDNVIIDISKDRYWTNRVIINGVSLSREEINTRFHPAPPK